MVRNPPITVPVGREIFKGREAVLNQVFGLWPAAPGYSRLGWSDPLPEDGGVRVTTSSALTLTFTFNDADEIHRVHLEDGYGSGASAPAARSGPVEEIPLPVKDLINNALANQTPIVVTYVDAQGAPHPSLHGSVCALNAKQFAIWVRHADGGLPRALGDYPSISLFYSDRRANAAVNVLGHASIATMTRRSARSSSWRWKLNKPTTHSATVSRGGD